MDSMEIDDGIYLDKNFTMEGLITTADFRRKPKTCRCVTVCLTLLCALLLAGNIGQIIYYEIITACSSAVEAKASYDRMSQETEHLQNESDSLAAERQQLLSNYDSLTAERKQLEARLRNLTEEKEQLQQSFTSLSSERDEFKAGFNNLKKARDGLQANYDTLKQQSSQLRTNFNDVQRSLRGLQDRQANLIVAKEVLQAKFSDLQKEKDNLQTRYVTVMTNRDQLQSNYSSLKRDSDQLQRNYNTMSRSKNGLQTSYNSLWKEREQLRLNYNSLWRENNELEANYSSLVTDKDKLQNWADKLLAKLKAIPCMEGWKKFDISCYYFSSVKKNWTESRKACDAQGADLVIIDSMEEQVFINKILNMNQNAWIGLSDSLKEGTWLWVDGSPVTRSFWQPGQPNSFNGNQDCAEFVQKNIQPGGEWNDDGCFAEQAWICEK
ncbi:CD209 antigen-like [Echeneis naucrates]|uniref:CD209 antigen-like n=1 Tax=Echeneis naucrates TaxID=173247 RepID=UPI001114405D|nr:CD209 antigen-like [Echeneis naucrates]